MGLARHSFRTVADRCPAIVTPGHLEHAGMAGQFSNPKLVWVWLEIPALPGLLPCEEVCSGYFKVAGIGTPMRLKASRWALAGSGSMGR